MKVREIMSSNVATCAPSAKLSEVAKLMKKHDCGAVPVVSNGKLEGIITDRDIVVRGLAEGKNIADMDAASLMSKSVHSVDQDASVDECMKLMESKQIRRIVVCDGNKIAGIVAQADVALNAPEKETGDVVKKVSK